MMKSGFGPVGCQQRTLSPHAATRRLPLPYSAYTAAVLLVTTDSLCSGEARILNPGKPPEPWESDLKWVGGSLCSGGATHRDKSREWGRLKTKVDPLLTLGNRGNWAGGGFGVDVTRPSHGARPVHLIITMIKWIRTSRLSLSG